MLEKDNGPADNDYFSNLSELIVRAVKDGDPDAQKTLDAIRALQTARLKSLKIEEEILSVKLITDMQTKPPKTP